MHKQFVMPLGSLPLSLVLISNGCVAIVPRAAFTAIIDQPEFGDEAVSAMFLPDFFVLGNDDEAEDYDYRAAYLLDAYPILKQWLIQQKLVNPFKEGE